MDRAQLLLAAGRLDETPLRTHQFLVTEAWKLSKHAPEEAAHLLSNAVASALSAGDIDLAARTASNDARPAVR